MMYNSEKLNGKQVKLCHGMKQIYCMPDNMYSSSKMTTLQIICKNEASHAANQQPQYWNE